MFDEDENDAFLGIHTLGDLTFYGMWAGGDWEYPVYFIIYWDGKKLRAYIPTDGNAYNTDAKKAYGNAETIYDKNGKIKDDEDMINVRKRYPEIFVAHPEIVEVAELYTIEEDIIDVDKMVADVQKRLVRK